MKEEMERLVPKLEKKASEIVKDQHKALNLACRRKVSIASLTGKDFYQER